MEKLFKKLLADGITREVAQAYINWLDEQENAGPNDIRFAYLACTERELTVLAEIKNSWLGRIWGLEVGGTCWCRWHTDMFKYDQLEKWRTGRIVNLRDIMLKGSKYEKVRTEYFFNIAGSSELRYEIPRVEDFEKIHPLVQEFSEVLKSLEYKGVVVQDWFLDEGYWACDSKDRLVVFDLKKGKVIPCDPEELYELRLVWIKT